MSKVDGGGGVRLTLLSRLRVTIFSRRLLGLNIECFLQNQPENVLKVFLKLLI